MKCLPWIIVILTVCVVMWFVSGLARRALDDLHTMSQDIHDLRCTLCPEEPMKQNVYRGEPKRENEVTTL